tara:strand:- start:71 stop:604 length:534 start_codon:yes stop_codon:yes gene_type:complete
MRSIKFDEVVLDEIQEFITIKNLDNFSEAVRILVKTALDEEKRKEKVKKMYKGVTIDHFNINEQAIINWFDYFEEEYNPTGSKISWFRKADFQKWWVSYSNTRDMYPMDAKEFTKSFSKLVKYGIFEVTNKVRENYLLHRKGPFYKMNRDRVNSIENRGGLIFLKYGKYMKDLKDSR